MILDAAGPDESHLQREASLLQISVCGGFLKSFEC